MGAATGRAPRWSAQDGGYKRVLPFAHLRGHEGGGGVGVANAAARDAERRGEPVFAATPLANAADLVGLTASPGLRDNYAGSVISHWSLTDPAAAARFATENSKSVDEYTRGELLSNWAESDPGAARAWLEGLAARAAGPRGLCRVLRWLVRARPGGGGERSHRAHGREEDGEGVQ